MTTRKIFVPVLIETAAQAEALPVGTVAILGWGLGSDLRTRTNGGWITRTGSALPSSEMISWTALVPVEARRVAAWDRVDEALDPAPSPDAHMWITGWKGD